VGYRTRGGQAFVLAPCQASAIHLKTFDSMNSAHTAACALNFKQGVRLGDVTYTLDKGACALPMETSLDELMVKGWASFNVDVCQVQGLAADHHVVSTTVCLLQGDPSRTVLFLERMMIASAGAP
jgi:hypothetical protein